MQNNNNNPQGPQTPPPAPQNPVTAPPAPRRQTELRQPKPNPPKNDPLGDWASKILATDKNNGKGNGHGHS